MWFRMETLKPSWIPPWEFICFYKCMSWCHINPVICMLRWHACWFLLPLCRMGMTSLSWSDRCAPACPSRPPAPQPRSSNPLRVPRRRFIPPVPPAAPASPTSASHTTISTILCTPTPPATAAIQLTPTTLLTRAGTWRQVGRAVISVPLLGRAPMWTLKAMWHGLFGRRTTTARLSRQTPSTSGVWKALGPQQEASALWGRQCPTEKLLPVTKRKKRRKMMKEALLTTGCCGGVQNFRPLATCTTSRSWLSATKTRWPTCKGATAMTLCLNTTRGQHNTQIHTPGFNIGMQGGLSSNISLNYYTFKINSRNLMQRNTNLQWSTLTF